MRNSLSGWYCGVHCGIPRSPVLGSCSVQKADFWHVHHTGVRWSGEYLYLLNAKALKFVLLQKKACHLMFTLKALENVKLLFFFLLFIVYCLI